MKILAADDDRDLRELIGFTLSQAGYLVLKAGDGPGALKMFEEESPDLVVLDINMPGASGFQVCEAIRKRSRVPVIMLTVRGEEEDLVRATTSPSRSALARCLRGSRHSCVGREWRTPRPSHWAASPSTSKSIPSRSQTPSRYA
jgi:CheY-like chemotaxis protein